MENERSRTAQNDDVASLVAKGGALHQAGRLDEAAKIYNEVLSRAPHDFDATHLLGVVALQQGKFDVAQRLIKAAIAIRANDAGAIGNLGTCYLRVGEIEAALRWFEIAAKLQPDSAVAVTNLAQVMYNVGRFRDAIPLLQKACALDPLSSATHNLLGACFIKIGDDHNAAALFEAAVHLDPNDAEAWANLSIASSAIGQNERSRDYADRAARLKPQSSAALNARAQAQLEQGRITEAAENYRRGTAHAAPSVDTFLSHAYVLLANGLQDDAVEQLSKALALDENNVTTRWALALAHLKTIYESETEVIGSREILSKSLDEIKSWYENTPGIDAPYTAIGAVQPFALAYQNYNNRDLLKRYGALCARFMSTLPRDIPRPAAAGVTLKERRLRLGIVSAHVRRHSIWTAVTKGWVEQLDRNRFEINVFHLDTTVDSETESVMQSVTHFDNRAKTLSEWIDAISARQLDVILYPEIGSHPQTLRLASLRMAPIQAVTWGHPETSGLPTIDLYISAEAFEPDGAAQNNYSEKLVTLPKFGVYVEPLSLPDADPELHALKLPSDQPLLLCPGQPFKYAPRYDDVWVRIARGLQKKTLFRNRPFGRLVFFRSHNETWDRMLEKRLRAAFDRGSLDFDAHVTIVPFLEHAKFYGLMRRSTLMLDTLGFSGFNTVLQGIECGLPVLAFEGTFMRGRLGSAIIRELSLSELVATNPDDFVWKAVSLAKNAVQLQELREKIVARRDKLFRDVTPVRALEKSLIEAVAHFGR